MNNEHFVYLLPRTDVAAHQKSILILEKHPGMPVVMTEAGSIKQAVSIVGRIRDATPTAEIIIDTGAPAGRDILHRSKGHLKFNARRFDPKIHLSQLFSLLKRKIPQRCHTGDQDFIELAVSKLFSARSLGGRRPCTESDSTVVEAGLSNPDTLLSDRIFTECFLHPLCFVPRFFIEESNRILGRRSTFLQERDMQDIVRLAACLARLRQSPFPTGEYAWFFATGEWDHSVCLRSLVDDFIFSVLAGSTNTRKRMSKKYPIQAEIVRLADRLLTSVEIQSSRLFAGNLNAHCYDTIRGFLDLICEVWTHSLYLDTDPRPQVMNLSVLASPLRQRFEQAVQPL